MNRSFFIIAFFYFQFPVFGVSLYAQDTTAGGQIKIYQDKRISDLVNWHIAFNEKNKTIPGFRIQLASDTRRDLVLEQKATFMQHYPGIKTYLTYQQPYFKLRSGDFRTRLEAQKILQEILPLFNGAFIVRDEISIGE